jgi:TonB family protein
MTSVLFEQKGNRKKFEPVIIAIYSIVPGIGQLYNGKTTKGILFLFATSISMSMLFASLNPSSTLQFALVVLAVLKFLTGFIFKFDFKPSPDAELLMNSIKFGGTFSALLILTIISFIIYSMIDAYMDADKALQEQQYEYKIISTDSTKFRFSESTASSYIIHSAFFGLLFLTSLFLVIPSKDKEQITEIEFILPQIESKKPPPPETKRRSTVQSIDQGKHIPNKPVAPPQPSRPVNPPPAVPKVIQQMVALPKPISPPQPKAVPKPVPKIADRPALIQSKPAPIQNVAPESVTQPQAAAPAPEAASNESSSPGTVTAVAIIPKVPGIPGRGGVGEAGNPPPNARPNAPSSIAAKKDIDFGPYMNELQRRIKRAWKPPRGNESKRVIVTFMIGKNGELSKLAVKGGSGFPLADKAALLAVQAAAPFARLPEGAPPSVDIEFTFDYNVFGSGGSYRKY